MGQNLTLHWLLRVDPVHGDPENLSYSAMFYVLKFAVLRLRQMRNTIPCVRHV